MDIIAKFIIGGYIVLSKISLRKLYLISSIVCWLLSHFDFFRFHKNVRKRIREAFPVQSINEHKQLEIKYYKCITAFAAEFIKFISFTKEDVIERMRYVNIDLLERLLEQHHYVVCYSGHFVNYELFTGLPLWLKGYSMCNFYDDSMRTIPYLDNWIKRLRSRYGAINIPTSSPLRGILDLYNETESGSNMMKGFVIGSLLDVRYMSEDKKKTFIMGQYFPLPNGTEKIGKRIGAAFVYANISCHKKGYYDVTLKELYPDETGSCMKAYISSLEENIRKQPELWLMWGSF